MTPEVRDVLALAIICGALPVVAACAARLRARRVGRQWKREKPLVAARGLGK